MDLVPCFVHILATRRRQPWAGWFQLSQPKSQGDGNFHIEVSVPNINDFFLLWWLPGAEKSEEMRALHSVS